MKIAAAAVLLACLIPACSPKLQPPEGGSCAANLVEVGKVMQAYVFARSGTFPAAASEPFTVDTSNNNWRKLICPEMRAEFAKDGLYSSYSYAVLSGGGRTWADEGTDFVLFDSSPVHNDARYVLLSDLSTVSSFPEAEFQSRLAEQKAKWEKKGRKLEIIDRTFVPLTPREIANYHMAQESPYMTPKFLVILGLIVAIAVIVVLMIYTKSRRKSSNPQI